MRRLGALKRATGVLISKENVYKEDLKRGGKLLELERPGLMPRPHFSVVAVVMTREKGGAKS